LLLSNFLVILFLYFSTTFVSIIDISELLFDEPMDKISEAVIFLFLDYFVCFLSAFITISSNCLILYSCFFIFFYIALFFLSLSTKNLILLYTLLPLVYFLESFILDLR
jgi:hypothetical protein